MSMNRLPESWRVIAAWVHPSSREPIVVVEMSNGAVAAWTLTGAICSVPWNWRDTPPDSCGLAVARALAARLTASRFDGGEDA